MRTFVCIILVVALLSGCESQPQAPGDAEVVPSVAHVHTEFLEKVFQEVGTYDPNLISGDDKVDIAYRVAKEIYEEYGLDPLTREEVVAAMDRGYQMAQQDPVELVKQALPLEQYEWWDRFASEATVEDARTTYEEMCETYGAPQPGTMLKDLVDISLSSAEFWIEKRADGEPRIKDPYTPIEQGWKRRLLRFAVNVVADGLAGGAAGAGTGGNVVAAGIVGGLASYAVDDILFGEGP